jgi:hypothetical protein
MANFRDIEMKKLLLIALLLPALSNAAGVKIEILSGHDAKAAQKELADKGWGIVFAFPMGDRYIADVVNPKFKATIEGTQYSLDDLEEISNKEIERKFIAALDAELSLSHSKLYRIIYRYEGGIEGIFNPHK